MPILAPSPAFKGGRFKLRATRAPAPLRSWETALELDSSFLIFALIGFGAQLIDGALGMGFGVISSTVLLWQGVPPAVVSASTHSAKLFTNGTAGVSHWAAGNISRTLLIRLSLFGILGGILGGILLVHVDADLLRPLVAGYLAIMGLLIVWRAYRRVAEVPDHSKGAAAPAGLVAGFLDAVGGGGWGPVTTSTLVGRGGTPRYVIGSVTMAEFFVSVAVVITLASFGSIGDWNVLGGLVTGGVIAAPFAGFTLKRIPTRPLMAAVGLLVIVLAGLMIARIFGWT